MIPSIAWNRKTSTLSLAKHICYTIILFLFQNNMNYFISQIYLKQYCTQSPKQNSFTYYLQQFINGSPIRHSIDLNLEVNTVDRCTHKPHINVKLTNAAADDLSTTIVTIRIPVEGANLCNF